MGYGDMQQFQMEHDQQHQQAIVNAGGQPTGAYGNAYQNWVRKNQQPQSYDPKLMGDPSDYLNTGYLDQLRGLAANKGQWEMSQRNLATSQAEAARQGLTRQGMSGMATAQGNLAMRGGLTSGASERLGQQNIQSQLMGQQGINRQLSDQQLGISSAADQRQRALLGQLGQHEMAAAQFGAGIDQWNLGQQNQAAKNAIMSRAIANQNVSPTDGGFLGIF